MTALFADRHARIWAGVLVFSALCVALSGGLPWLKSYPDSLVLPVTPILNDIMTWFVGLFGWAFRDISFVLAMPIEGVRQLLQWLPWPFTMGVCVIVAHAAAGWRLAAFTGAAMLYMAAMGYWVESMNTLALVAISVPLSVLVGFGFGVWAFVSRRAERIIMPTLDLMQTVPTFAYLLPILLLFGFGAVVGLIASLLFAFPPMVRNTVLGLQRVSPEVVESGTMSGATGAQLFWQIRVPSAKRQIMLGVNQTTMAALSMVIVASIIGGTGDIGWAVLSTMRKAVFGESLLAGIVIAFIAMAMDRITWAFATGESNPHAAERPFMRRHAHLLLAAVLFLAVLVLAQVEPALATWPKDWTINPAKPINDAITWVVVNFKSQIDLIKRGAFFYLMLPLRVGLEQAVRPMTWGFTFTSAHAIGYAVLALAGAAWVLLRGKGPRPALAVVGIALLFFVGMANFPWPALAAVFVTLAWSTGGVRLAIGILAGLAFLLLTGIWTYAVLSIYLCGIAVLISFALGTTLGIWAAHDNRVSAFLRPINDTLQTMPLFVILIPIIMIFKLGDFTAVLAIVAYATVPAIRYAESALRSLPETVIEAGTAMGCTRWQLLWQVKLPIALPEMMLGLNQTIMYGISMLVITALVGTTELGQRVYVGLSDGDFGVGIVAGIGMAIIAMSADRMTQSWSASRRKQLGLA